MAIGVLGQIADEILERFGVDRLAIVHRTGEVPLGEVSVAWPAGLEAPSWLGAREEVDVTGWREACDGLILEHMSRGPDDDPWFFASAFAAGKLARALLG